MTVKINLFPKPAVYLAIAVYLTLTFFALGAGNQVLSATVREDRYFETVGASSLFITGLLFFFGFLRARRLDQSRNLKWIKQLVYLGLAVIFVFGAGEEISWGQRIFNIKTPTALETTNVQDELNLHNLAAVEKSDLFNADRMFDMFWFGFTIMIPVVGLSFKSVKQFIERIMPIVPLALGFLFLYNYALAKIAKAVFDAGYTYNVIPFAQAVQEIKESNYAILFVLVGLFALWDLNNTRNESTHEMASASFK
ncbi:MAG: hypothetical protein HZB19_19425 [Chloroflexi bacterium]|nr:hypothetical protein [Chloroflexota bacterium]